METPAAPEASLEEAGASPTTQDDMDEFTMGLPDPYEDSPGG